MGHQPGDPGHLAAHDALEGDLGLGARVPLIAPELLELFSERGTHHLVTGDTAPTGQSYTVNGANAGSVYTGQIAHAPGALSTVPGSTGAFYLMAELAGARGISGGMSFRFRNDGGSAPTQTYNATCGLFDSADNPQNGQIHIVVGPTTTQVSKVVAGSVVPLNPVAHNTSAPSHKQVPLAYDGVSVYDTRYVIDPIAQRAAVRTPDGGVLYYSDPCFAIASRFAFIESIVTATTDAVPEFLSWYADSTRRFAL